MDAAVHSCNFVTCSAREGTASEKPQQPPPLTCTCAQSSQPQQRAQCAPPTCRQGGRQHGNSAGVVSTNTCVGPTVIPTQKGCSLSTTGTQQRSCSKYVLALGVLCDSTEAAGGCCWATRLTAQQRHHLVSTHLQQIIQLPDSGSSSRGTRKHTTH